MDPGRQQFGFGSAGRHLAVALAVVVSASVAMAQQGKLSVHVSPKVIASGQHTNVDVFAHFTAPPDPTGAYAFASSTFNMHVNDPLWMLVSAGGVIGGDVVGIHISQNHMPPLGIYANPANPIRVWHGVYAPQTNGPALIEIEADPSDFSVYPSDLTSSAAPCEAIGGSDFVFVEPLRVGEWLAAPGAGTEIQYHDDVMIDGRIITGGDYSTVKIGLTPIKLYQCPSEPVSHAARNAVAFVSLSAGVPMFSPPGGAPPANGGDDMPIEDLTLGYGKVASPYLKHSSTRVEFDQAPTSFRASVQVENVEPAAQRSRVTNMTVTFSLANSGTYASGAMFLMGDGSVRPVRYHAYSGGVRVASGDFNSDSGNGASSLIISALPGTIDARSGGGAGKVAYADLSLTMSLKYAEPIQAIVRGVNGIPLTLMVDRIDIEPTASEGPDSLGIEVHSIRASAGPNRVINNLKQLGLASHVFEATGVEQMKITPQSVPAAGTTNP